MLREGGTPNEQSETVMATLKLLGDDVRLNILLRLSGNRMNVGELCEAFSMGQPAISHHLALLKKGEVLTGERAGKNQFYSLPENGVQRIQQAARALEALGTERKAQASEIAG